MPIYFVIYWFLSKTSYITLVVPLYIWLQSSPKFYLEIADTIWHYRKYPASIELEALYNIFALI
jgi:hypothetical protein